MVMLDARALFRKYMHLTRRLYLTLLFAELKHKGRK
jgi:hypothetical protein